MNITQESPATAPEGTKADDDVRALRKREYAVLVTLLAIAIVAYVCVKRVVVDGRSMEPTFHSGQSAFVWTSVPRDWLHPGDIIVFNSPDGGVYIKRIVFIQNRQGTLQPPDNIWTTDGDQPFVLLFENFYWKEPYHRKLVNQVNVPPVDGRSIWVLGDNYEHSEDSRDFGPIAPKSIIGKVIM